MKSITVFVLAIAISFIGSLPAGVINTTVMARAIRENLLRAAIMAFGASLVEGVQIYVALTAAEIILYNYALRQYLRWFSVLVFLAFALYFFLTRKREVEKDQEPRLKSPLLEGMLVSTLNVLVFPYWAFYATWLQNRGFVQSPLSHWVELVLGGMVGGFVAFYLYALGGKWLSEKIEWVNRRINLLLSIVFVVLALATALVK